MADTSTIQRLLQMAFHEEAKMRPEIHPAYQAVDVTCSCGNTFTTGSTYGKDKMQIDVCSECHPFYTGKQKVLDSAGQIEKFNKRFGGKK